MLFKSIKFKNPAIIRAGGANNNYLPARNKEVDLHVLVPLISRSAFCILPTLNCYYASDSFCFITNCVDWFVGHAGFGTIQRWLVT